jgi:hypothetical protein
VEAYIFNRVTLIIIIGRYDTNLNRCARVRTVAALSLLLGEMRFASHLTAFAIAVSWSLVAVVSAETRLQPKNIDIALTARWELTPVDAEAAEFLFWSFVASYRPPSESTDRSLLQAVEAVATGLLSPLGLQLLRAFLTAHVFSPRVELWRKLASSEQEEHGLQIAGGWVRACGRVRALGNDPAVVAAALADEVVGEGCAQPTSLEERETSDGVPLAVDHVYPGSGSASNALGSTAFTAAHAELVRRATTASITYTYRPLVVGSGRTQTLQGYGVQLAIKNMEYKVLDDQAVKVSRDPTARQYDEGCSALRPVGCGDDWPSHISTLAASSRLPRLNAAPGSRLLHGLRRTSVVLAMAANRLRPTRMSTSAAFTSVRWRAAGQSSPRSSKSSRSKWRQRKAMRRA